MIKKLFIILVTLLGAITASAQGSVGSWEKFSSFGTSISKIVDSPSIVYYISNGYLFGYDKVNGSMTAYTAPTTLSDNDVESIAYDRDGGYLCITYGTGNIDFLYDNGDVVNIPDIKDAVIGVEKKINRVSFAKNRCYVSTSFGLVIVDTKGHHVVDSGIYGESVNGAVELDGNIVMIVGTQVYTTPRDKSIRSLSAFTKMNSVNAEYNIDRVGDMLVVDGAAGVRVYKYTFPYVANGYDLIDNNANLKNVSSATSMADGSLTFIHGNTLYQVTPEGKIVSLKSLAGTPLAGNVVSTDKGLSSVWAGNGEGIANYDLSGTAITVLSDRAKPTGVVATASPVFITADESGEKIYIGNRGRVGRLPGTSGGDLGVAMGLRSFVTKIDNGVISDASGYTAKKDYRMGSVVNYPNNPQTIVVDPDNHDAYYIASGSEGVYHVEGDKITGQYYAANSQLYPYYGIFSYGLGIDPEGNLWVLISDNTAIMNNISVHILPAAFRKKPTNEVKPEDWKTFKLDYGMGYDPRILFCKNSNIALIVDGGYQNGITVIDTKGTYANPADDKVYKINNFIDQDGNSNMPLYSSSLVEDKKGRVWIGTAMGVFELTNPEDAADGVVTFNRIKVPRNDGTNYADYLLASDLISCISVDNSNRKWIGTMDSGLYLVSENGDEILENFTVDNSALPTNTIAGVYADKLSNDVWVGTLQGLLRYKSNSSPVMENYDNVYAYPNPVRPDYTGWITIAGLMDNSLVKIADTQGNVLYQTQSEGGMATWDGCDGAGNRVKTGVYYVFASQNENEQSSGAVTKILVVK